MSKIVIIVLVIIVLGAAGLLVYKNMSLAPATSSIPSLPTPTVSPIFSYLPTWVPAAAWSAPQKSTQDTSYGKLTGMEATGKITDKGTFSGRNFEDVKIMNSLGYAAEDMSFAADGPGASNWGYTKTENGKSQSVIFSYSTNRLLGPESKSPPFANISIFVSDPFEKK